MTEQRQSPTEDFKAKNLNEQDWAKQQEARANEHYTITVNKRRAGMGALGALGAVAVLGLGYALGGGLNGKPVSAETTSSPSMTATPKASEAAGSATPSPIKTVEVTAKPTEAPSATATEMPSQSPEGFVPAETNTAEGWYRQTIELIDGSNLDVDRLDFDPMTMKDGKTLMAGAVISGDVNLDGKFNTDSNAQTGQVTLNQKDGAVLTGVYAAGIYENFDPAKTDLLFQTIENNDLNGGGCGLPDGCKSVLKNVYNTDGSYTDYTPGVQPSTNPEQTPGDCTCPTPTPEATPTPSCSVTPSETPMPSQTPAASCEPGYDHNLDNIYNGNLQALKKDNNPDYLFVAQPGDRFAIQGDVDVVVNGKVKENYDNNGATGAITYISVPEGEQYTVYVLFGGDVHKMASCTTDTEANDLINYYKSQMENTYGAGNVKEYDVK